MATASGDQDFCRILVRSDDEQGNANTQCGLQSDSQTCVDASVICHKPVDDKNSDSFPSCLVTVDIEKGANDVSKIDQETCGSIKTEISLTKPLRRQNSIQTGGESIPPLMNHILMLLKFNAKDRQPMEKAHDATHNRWRKYKRPGLFDSRRIVLLFSILSSMGTIVLIFLTLRVRQVSEGYIHG
ncbi:uncharacterized protein LOC110717812 [Chenopodium quinoa]|uniref:Uncharacterized protein n=1 Tax=Chenopodium quinoa TaxID=63459 RepID=A0A803KSJ7_CHEQI|nr:uncharacterized protein LOC110717812 [Chenopodium quinoa]